MKRLPLLLLICMLGFNHWGFAQTGAEPTGPAIQIKPKSGDSNAFSFEIVNLPKLEKPPGGQKEPAYKLFWEFGDGEFSLEKNPTHTYGEMSTETFDSKVICHIHTVYFDSSPRKIQKKSPRRRMNKSSASISNPHPFFDQNNSEASIGNQLSLAVNRQPKASEYFTSILSYQAREEMMPEGRLYFFYNENKSCSNCFTQKDKARTYHQEEFIPDAYSALDKIDQASSSIKPMPAPHSPSSLFLRDPLEKLQADYKSQSSWRFEALNKGEKRNIFIDFATDDALRDTSLTTKVVFVLVDNEGNIVEKKVKELKLVAAHDPNNILSDSYYGKLKRRHKLAWKKKRKLDFKINFQNEGEDDADTIRIETALPNSLNVKTLKIKGAKIGTDKVDTKDTSLFKVVATDEQLVFYFTGVSLAGSKQEGVDYNDTKGFVEYEIKTRKKKAKTIASEASIFFDTRPAVVTKRSKIEFKNSYKSAIGLGLVIPSATKTYNAQALFSKGFCNKFIDLAVAPYRAEGWLFFEAGLRFSQSCYISKDKVDIGPVPEFLEYDFVNASLYVVPKIGLGRWLAVGGGVQLNSVLSASLQGEKQYALLGDGMNPMYEDLFDVRDYEFLLDATIGRIQEKGLVLGAQYAFGNLKSPITAGQKEKTNRIFAFLRWKF